MYAVRGSVARQRPGCLSAVAFTRRAQTAELQLKLCRCPVWKIRPNDQQAKKQPLTLLAISGMVVRATTAVVLQIRVEAVRKYSNARTR